MSTLPLLAAVDLSNNGYARADCLTRAQADELQALLADGTLTKRGNCIMRPATYRNLAGEPEFTPARKPAAPDYGWQDWEAAILARQARWQD